MGPRIIVTRIHDGSRLPARGVSLNRCLAWPVGQATVCLPPGIACPDLDETITLVAEDDNCQQLLFTGTIQQVVRTDQGDQLSILEPSASLAWTRLEESWQNTTLSAVIAEICQRHDVLPGAQEAGLAIPSLTIIKDRPLLAELQRLARLAATTLFVDCHGLLQNKTALAVPGTLVITPQQAVFSCVSRRRKSTPTVAVRGTGAMASRGIGSQSWLLADPGAMTEGDFSQADITMESGCLKSVADVKKLQQSEEERWQEAGQAITLQLAQVVDVDLFANITLLDFNKAVDGLARVVGLAAGFTSETGFTLRLDLNTIS